MGPKQLHSQVRRRRWSRRRRLTREWHTFGERLVAIVVSMDGASVLVTLSDGALKPPPYLVENLTGSVVTIQQRGAAHKRRSIAPMEELAFAWHAPAGRHEVQLFGGGGVAPHGKASSRSTRHAAGGVIALDEINSRSTMLRTGPSVLWFRVSLRGDTRVLTLRDKQDDKDKDKKKRRGALGNKGGPLRVLIDAAMQGIGISLVRSGVRELAYMRLSHLRFDLSQRGDGTKVNVIISDLRLDNQAQDAQLPSVIIRTRQQRSAFRDASTTAAASSSIRALCRRRRRLPAGPRR